jgi:hypothetical protein
MQLRLSEGMRSDLGVEACLYMCRRDITSMLNQATLEQRLLHAAAGNSHCCSHSVVRFEHH